MIKASNSTTVHFSGSTTINEVEMFFNTIPLAAKGSEVNFSCADDASISFINRVINSTSKEVKKDIKLQIIKNF